MKYIIEVSEQSRLDDGLFFIKAFKKMEKQIMDKYRKDLTGEDILKSYYAVRDSIVEGVNAAMQQSGGKTQFNVLETGFGFEGSFHIKEIDS